MSVLIASAALAMAISAVAQQAAPANPCDVQPEFSQFDFWVGDWNVYQSDGALAGVNRITKTDGGCLIREQWRSVQGGSGFSINFYDVAQSAWRQIWVSPGAQIDYSGGLDEAGAMRLEGTITYPATSNSAPFRGAWSQLEDGAVLQEFHQLDAETGEWAIWFTGRYVPAATEPNQADAAALWAQMD